MHRIFFFFQILIHLVGCQLISTGIAFDENSKDNGYLVYTSKVVLPNDYDRIYSEPGNIYALAIQAYNDMATDCQNRGFLATQCPRAMTVFAKGRELHFGSSVRKYRSPDSRNPIPNYQFYYGFLEATRLSSADSRSSIYQRLTTAMIQCQTRELNILDATEQNTRGQCGEFTSLFLYLLSQPDPTNVNLGQSTILTVGRRDGNNLHSGATIFLPCRNNIYNLDSTYGCHNWLDTLGISSPRNVRVPSAVPDPGSRVDSVKLCDLFGDEEYDDLDGMDLGKNRRV